MVGQHALESLGYSSHEGVPDLIEVAFNSKEIKWVTSALLAMGRTCDYRWEPHVLKMLVHPSPEIRIKAVQAAGELEIPLAKPQLLEYLEEDDREIRMAAVWSLSQIGGTGLHQTFGKLLEETDDDEEAQIIEEALDNLIFNQSIGLYDPIDFDDRFDFIDIDTEEEY
jgi:HEAT repeat protein